MSQAATDFLRARLDREDFAAFVHAFGGHEIYVSKKADFPDEERYAQICGRYRLLRGQGVRRKDALRIVADEVCLSQKRVENILAARHPADSG